MSETMPVRNTTIKIELKIENCKKKEAGRRVRRPWAGGVDSPPKHLDMSKGAPLRLPKPLSDQFPVRVCSCALCIETVCKQENALWAQLVWCE